MLKILMVEDRKYWVDYFRLGMKNRALPLALTWAPSGGKALDILLENDDFDVVVMNLEMPEGISGIETTLKIRAMGLEIPIIAWTSHLPSYKKEACYRAGMNDYIERKGTSMIKDISMALERVVLSKNRGKQGNRHAVML